MRVCSIGSGSKGNGTLVQSQDTCVLVDCGFGLKESIQRLSCRDIQIESLSALLLTHEHGDHARGVDMLARKANIPLYLSSGTYQALTERALISDTVDIHIIDPEKTFHIGSLEIEPVTVPHDSREACQFIFRNQQRCFGLLTDAGSITPHIINRYANCQSIFLEFNHDLEMLMSGPYPEKLKQRVAGAYGHLSNQQAINFLAALDVNKLKTLVISHISEQNNSLDLVKSLLQERFHFKQEDWLVFADQEQGCSWMDVY